MQNKYVLWPDLMLFYGALPKQIALHQHPIIQLIIGLEKPFLKKNKQGNWEPFQSLLIAPNVTHECDAANQRIFTLTIDPESSLGEFLQETYLQNADFVQLSNTMLEQFDPQHLQQLLIREDHRVLRQYLLRFLGPISPPSTETDKDERIESVKAYLKRHLHERITTQELCEQVFLSESRLLHLFKQEMGLPIRNYILWLRLTRAIERIMDGENLTRAAHEAVFFDSSHMSRTFVQMLGINPAEIVKNSKFIQVSVAQGA